MSTCASIDPLLTAYIDGELPTADRVLVDEHLRRCVSCYSRAAAEGAARDAVKACKAELAAEEASSDLRARCSEAALTRTGLAAELPSTGPAAVASPARWWSPRRIVPQMGLPQMALAASLTLFLGGVVLYQATHYSSRLLAAELAADHVKCFAASRLLGTRQGHAAVESTMIAAFGWRPQLPEQFDASGFELVGSRRCLYAEGRIAHVMYRDDRGRPISIFMLPRRARPEELVEVLGHEAAIWSAGDRTFVLVTRGTRAEAERLASMAKAALQ
jgi:anti-sigma factor RsiW